MQSQLLMPTQMPKLKLKPKQRLKPSLIPRITRWRVGRRGRLRPMLKLMVAEDTVMAMAGVDTDMEVARVESMARAVDTDHAMEPSPILTRSARRSPGSPAAKSL